MLLAKQVVHFQMHLRLQVGAGFKNLFMVFAGLSLCILIPLSATAQRNNLDKQLQQAATLIRERRIAEAERELMKILKLAPDDASALNLLGTIRAGQGRLDDAEILFARAIRRDKQLLGAQMNLAYLYLLKGAPEMAIAKLKEVRLLAPNNSEAFYKLARLLLTQNHFDECIKLIETSQPPIAVPVLVILADAYLEKGDAEKAEETYLLALGKQSKAAEALMGIARVASLKKDSKTAAYYLSRARSLIGNSPDLLYRYALTALKSGIYEEAQSGFEQAIKLNSKEPAYHLALGATWLKKPDIFAAEQCFRRALQLQPENAEGQMYLGYTLLKQKNYGEARAYLEKSIRSDANIPESFYYLALIAQEQNDDAQAIGILQKLVGRFPAFVNANVHIALGSSYMKLKNYATARQHLEMAVKLNPDEVKAHYNLAMLYARLNDPQRAQEEMQIVERLKNSKAQSGESEMLTPPLLRHN